MNFAPDADLNNNPLNPIINTRSFGEDPRAVSALVTGYVRGVREHGMLATLKHFPGHGDTETDSHLGLPVITADYARLDTLELVPFRAGIAAGADVVMSAHIAFPAFTGGRRPRHALARRAHGAAARFAPLQRPRRHRRAHDGRDRHASTAPARRRCGRSSRARISCLMPANADSAEQAMLDALAAGRVH